MTVTATDALTVEIQSTISTHIMASELANYVFVIYKKVGDNFVYTGPYAVDTFVAGSNIDLVPNEHYFDGKAAQRPRKVVVKKFAGGDALAAGMLDKSVDVGFHLPIPKLPEIRSAAGVQVVTFEIGYHYMMFHNTKRATMADVRVRKAIDLAIDRNALQQTLKVGKGTRSLFPDYTPYYSDSSDPAADATAAGVLLDDAGWTLDTASGKRTKVCPTVVAPKVSDVSGSESFAAALAFAALALYA
jgi:peptide/nickel transport system substrate-binding protein